MYFATLYDGTTRIDDCILNGAEELNVTEGDLVKGMLHFEEARNKKYSDLTYYLSKIEKIKTTERYDALGKFNVQATEPLPVVEIKKVEETIEKPKLISRKKKEIIGSTEKSDDIQIEIPLVQPKMISRKKVIEVVEVQQPKMISRKKKS
jgi:hypothetical protein